MTTDLIARGAAWHRSQCASFASRTVTYTRNGSTVDVDATPGRTTWDVADSDGLQQTWESRDFIITAADLVLGGNALLPERGDTITDVQDGTTYIYQVLAPGDVPPWRHTASRLGLRIHTKLHSTA